MRKLPLLVLLGFLFSATATRAETPAKSASGPWDVKALQTVVLKPIGERRLAKVGKCITPASLSAGSQLGSSPTTANPRATARSRRSLLVHGGGGKAFRDWAEHWAGTRLRRPGHGPRRQRPQGAAGRRRPRPGRRDQIPRLHRQGRPRHVDLPRRRRRPPRALAPGLVARRSIGTGSPSPASAGAAT